MRYAIVILMSVLALASADTILSRVNDALDAGDISPDEAVMLLHNSLYDLDMIPIEYTDNTISVPCGMSTMDRITVLLEDCTAPIREEMLDLARPEVGSPEYLYDTPGGNFKIHWTDTGINATSLAWVETCAEGLDYAWEQEVNVLEWDAPPSDLGIGGDDRLDVYMINIEGGVIGWCTSAGNPPDPTTPEADYASHIALDADESWGEVQIQSTCAHEFQHAIQNGYEAAEPSWFKENCATWMEYKVGYDTYAAYLHGGDNCLRRPWYDIRSMDEGLYEYGCTPWPMYMQYRCGGQEAVRMVWENCAAVQGANMLDALNTTAEYYGLSFLDWLAEYDAWRWFTGHNASDHYYPLEECSLWTPGPYTFAYHTISSLPASGDEGVYPPEVYGLHWIKVDVTSYQKWIEFAFNGRDNFQWHVGVIQSADDGRTAFQYHTVDNTSATLDLAADAEGWDEVIFYVQPIFQTTLTMTYEFDITEMTGIEGTEGAAELFTVTPSANPIISGQSILLDIPTSGFTTLNVFDITGRMVQNIYTGDMQAGQNTLAWDAGALSAGTYFLRLSGIGGGASVQVVLSN